MVASHTYHHQRRGVRQTATACTLRNLQLAQTVLPRCIIAVCEQGRDPRLQAEWHQRMAQPRILQQLRWGDDHDAYPARWAATTVREQRARVSGISNARRLVWWGDDLWAEYWISLASSEAVAVSGSATSTPTSTPCSCTAANYTSAEELQRHSLLEVPIAYTARCLRDQWFYGGSRWVFIAVAREERRVETRDRATLRRLDRNYRLLRVKPPPWPYSDVRTCEELQFHSVPRIHLRPAARGMSRLRLAIASRCGPCHANATTIEDRPFSKIGQKVGVYSYGEAIPCRIPCTYGAVYTSACTGSCGLAGRVPAARSAPAMAPARLFLASPHAPFRFYDCS